jgi:hypothetical protein
MTAVSAGLLYSVGEGRAYQLGLTSALQCGVRDAVSGAIAPVKAAAYAAQRVPKQVLPSGTLRFGKDVHCVQAAAGNTHFSIAAILLQQLHALVDSSSKTCSSSSRSTSRVSTVQPTKRTAFVSSASKVQDHVLRA